MIGFTLALQKRIEKRTTTAVQEFLVTQVLLQIKNLTKSFGEIQAVQNLSLDILSGEVFGLLGPNGAGKTTTINLISGMLKPDAG